MNKFRAAAIVGGGIVLTVVTAVFAFAANGL